MKTILAVILLLPVLSFGQAVDTVDVSDLELKNGLYYKRGSDIPFTGVSVSLAGEKKEEESHYKLGKLDGHYIYWYPSGYKESEGNYKDGEKDGLWIQWHAAGKTEENYLNGKLDGPWISYFRTDSSYQSGNWDELEKDQEGYYKDGKKEGLWTEWHENGQKSSEGNYMDGALQGLLTYWHDNGQKGLEVNYKDGQEISRKEWDENGKEIKN